MIQFIHMGEVRYIWACQKRLPILNLQYVKTELSYDYDFMHMGRHPEKQQNDSVISINLTVWFLRFDHKLNKF